MCLNLPGISELAIPPVNGGFGAFIFQDFIEPARLLRFCAFNGDIEFERVFQSITHLAELIGLIDRLLGNAYGELVVTGDLQSARNRHDL